MFGWEMSAAEKYDPKPAIIATGVVSGPIDACLLVPFGLPAMAIQFFIKVAQKDKLKRDMSRLWLIQVWREGLRKPARPLIIVYGHS